MKAIRSIGLSAAVFALAACGGSETEMDVDQMIADNMAAANANASTFEDGFDICFEKTAELLGGDAMVSEIRTLFSSGNEIDSMQSQPRGIMTACDVEYQDPSNPNKMLSIKFDNSSGEFSEPRELEITVVGGNASEFKVADYVMPLKDVNIAGLGAFMDGKKAALDGAYSDFAWSSITLNSPGMTERDHTLKATLTGRLATNDVKETASVSMKTDGATIVRDGLVPS